MKNITTIKETLKVVEYYNFHTNNIRIFKLFKFLTFGLLNRSIQNSAFRLPRLSRSFYSVAIRQSINRRDIFDGTPEICLNIRKCSSCFRIGLQYPCQKA